MKIASLMAIAALLALTRSYGRVPALIPLELRAENALDPAGAIPQDERSAWDLANKAGTPSAFRNFYRIYPHSAKVKVATGTLRGRYWFRVGDPRHTDGVMVTVAGMKVLTSISLRDALAMHVVNSRPYPVGTKYDAVGRTFNYVYMEVVEGWFPPVSVGRGGVQTQVVSPKDSLKTTVVLSADGKRLLTWDLGKSETAESPGLETPRSSLEPPRLHPLPIRPMVEPGTSTNLLPPHRKLLISKGNEPNSRQPLEVDVRSPLKVPQRALMRVGKLHLRK